MRLVKLLSLVLLLLTAYGQELSLAAVKQAFEDADVNALLYSTVSQTLTSTCLQIPGDLQINFNPKVLLEIALPQTSGLPILVHPGIQLPRNGKQRFLLLHS
jgi:hypothetical protein